MAASVTTATGATTPLMSERFEASSTTVTTAAMAAMMRVVITICRSMRCVAVTYRITPTVVPAKLSGHDTARIFSPVAGSRPS